MKMKFAALLLAALLAAISSPAQDDTNALSQVDTNAPVDTNALAEYGRLAGIAKNLKYEHGTIDLRNGLAKLTLPPEFSYLGPDDAETVLVKLWHNPPSEQKPLGLLIPTGMTPLSTGAWVVTIDYSEDGYVKDDDAKKINYNDLLKTMQKSISEDNQARAQQGYSTFTLVGWAEPPHYDAATHKLYWAKELKVDGETDHTLNYSIRMLGRKGVLELNAVADMAQLAEIDKQTPQILGMVDFNGGSRYTDFDPKVDKVATYGIAALVAGGIAAKAGLFKLLWVGILAAKKFIIIGAVAVGAWFKKMFGGRNKTPGI
jgi:uncharacterized membrane-anchored protein